MLNSRSRSQLNNMFGHIGFYEVVSLVTKRERNSCNSSTRAIFDDASTYCWVRVPLSRPIKVGFVPILRGERPSSFLSSLDPFFLTGFTIPTFLDVSSLGYRKVIENGTFNFLYIYELWRLSFSKYSINALFLDSPVEVWESP